MMPFSAKPSQPPLKDTQSNGSLLYRHFPLTASTPSPTCLVLISLTAVHIKPQPSLSSTSDRNKTRRCRPSSTVSARPPFAHLTSTKRWHCNVWPSLSNPAPSLTTSTYTHPHPCTNWSFALQTTSAWKRCKPSIRSSVMITHPPLPPLAPNHPHGLIPDPENPDNLASLDTYP